MYGVQVTRAAELTLAHVTRLGHSDTPACSDCSMAPGSTHSSGEGGAAGAKLDVHMGHQAQKHNPGLQLQQQQHEVVLHLEAPEQSAHIAGTDNWGVPVPRTHASRSSSGGSGPSGATASWSKVTQTGSLHSAPPTGVAVALLSREDVSTLLPALITFGVELPDALLQLAVVYGLGDRSPLEPFVQADEDEPGSGRASAVRNVQQRSSKAQRVGGAGRLTGVGQQHWGRRDGGKRTVVRQQGMQQ